MLEAFNTYLLFIFILFYFIYFFFKVKELFQERIDRALGKFQKV